MPSLKLSNPFRRGADRLSLKERAAALKAGLARIGRRADPEADQGRRAMMAGSLAAVVPLPALAAASAIVTAGPHPDQPVFDAEATMLRAERAYVLARDASERASADADAEIEICPPGLLMSNAEAGRLIGPFAPREIVRYRVFEWVKAHADDEQHDGRAWTPKGLHIAILYAVSVFGQGGTTPKRIARYRALLPLAETFHAHRDAAKARHRTRELHAEYMAAGRAMSAARDALDTMRATTPAGLAVLARHVASYDSKRLDEGWIGLLESAAAMGGVDLHAPREPRTRTMFM